MHLVGALGRGKVHDRGRLITVVVGGQRPSRFVRRPALQDRPSRPILKDRGRVRRNFLANRAYRGKLKESKRPRWRSFFTFSLQLNEAERPRLVSVPRELLQAERAFGYTAFGSCRVAIGGVD